MGGDLETEGVDPAREFFPAGQGAGGITELIPAGDIVRGMVAEAEQVLAETRRVQSGSYGIRGRILTDRIGR